MKHQKKCISSFQGTFTMLNIFPKKTASTIVLRLFLVGSVPRAENELLLRFRDLSLWC
jgi:hypothetical protein